MSKVESAKIAIQAFNSNVDVQTFEKRFTNETADMVAEYDVVMDGSDNAGTRYLLNDACTAYGKPLVSGSALQWEGQVTTLIAHDAPCYRCLYPKPPPAYTVTNCSDGGVLGMVPGLIG